MFYSEFILLIVLVPELLIKLIKMWIEFNICISEQYLLKKEYKMSFNGFIVK
jgi:hypothetical protein